MKRFGPIATAAVLSLVGIQIVVGDTAWLTSPTPAGAPAGTTRPTTAATTHSTAKADAPKIKKGMTLDEAQTAADALDPTHAPHAAVQDTKTKSTTTEFWMLDVFDESDHNVEADRHYRLAMINGVIDHMTVNTTRTPKKAMATTTASDGTDPAATGIGTGTGTGATDGTGTDPNSNSNSNTNSNNQNNTGNTGTTGTSTNNTNTGGGTPPGGGYRGGGGGGRGRR